MEKIKELNWNYQMPIPVVLYDAQPDWNQTIVTKLNQIWATNRPFDVVPVAITVPNKFKDIIESLMFYDKETRMMSNRFIFEFIDTDVNYLDYGGVAKLYIDNFKTE